MALLDLIRQRKSVREFLDKPVEREKIEMCLEAARLAPSESNSQPWRFIVVDDKELKDRLCDAAFGGLYFINNFCKTAPVIVAVISEKSKFIARVGGMFRGVKFYLIDIGIMMVKAALEPEQHERGIWFLGRQVAGEPEFRKKPIVIKYPSKEGS